MGKSLLASNYLDYLFEAGFSAKMDDDGDVLFKHEGRTYILFVNDNDPEFFRLALPNFWPIESDDERVQVLLAAADTTAKTKVAKVFARGDNVWATIELFCPTPTAYQSVFKRSLGALDTALDHFAGLMRS